VIYTCAKCTFLFERKNEPSKCPSCENQCIVQASSNEQQKYKELYNGRQRSILDDSDFQRRDTTN